MHLIRLFHRWLHVTFAPFVPAASNRTPHLPLAPKTYRDGSVNYPCLCGRVF